MPSLKKTVTAVLAICSGSVFAGTMGPICVPGSVTVPCASTAWDFGAKALYLQPVLTADLGYIAASTDLNRVTNSIERPLNWGFGYMIEGSYHFRTGNDVNLNWYHFDKSANQRFNVSTASVGAVPAFTSRFDVISSTKPEWDAVNLELAQHVDFGEFTSIRFHGGGQYARISSNSSIISNTLSLSTSRVNSIATTYNNRSANGFGPRAGLDMSYLLFNGFSLNGNAAAALLVGTSKFNSSSSTYTVASNTTGPTTFTKGSKTSLIPELELKLGATYNYLLPSGSIMVDAGYMWLNYFNANHNGTSTSGSPTSSSLESDFGLNGIYAGLKWVGNFA